MIELQNAQEIVLALLGREIAQARRSTDAERSYPARSTDSSGDFIKEGQEKTKKLESIRLDLEKIFFGEIE